MLKKALEFLKIVEDNGYEAYIVGGYVRDYILGIKSSDIDICTNAKPADIKNIFEDAIVQAEQYGSVTVIYKKVRFEVTTYRSEIKYVGNRKPIEIVYINDLMEDIYRRDFTINSLCMNQLGEIIDPLDGRKDIENKVVRTIGNANLKMKEDSLRILRAIRFATSLNFKIDVETKKAIMDTKKYLKNISYQRKKSELEKIFLSNNSKYGIKLILELKLLEELEISNLKNIVLTEDLLGIWAQLDVTEKYPFDKNESHLISSIKELMNKDPLDKENIYKYGLYVSTVVGNIKGLDKKQINNLYNSLPIKERNEIAVDGKMICDILNIKPSIILRNIISDLERNIILGSLNNNYESIREYLIKQYS